MTIQRYSWQAMALHWAQAILILWLLWLGWTMTDLPKGAERSAAYGLHKSLGLLALLVLAVRLFWRRRNPPPQSLAQGWEARLATGDASRALCAAAARAAGRLSGFIFHALRDQVFRHRNSPAVLAGRNAQWAFQATAPDFRLGNRRLDCPSSGRRAQACVQA